MRYSAFISYSHADGAWARWLHRALETYRLPKRLQNRETSLGKLDDRLPPVFRDSDELAASASLGAEIRAALEQSANLVVICSPNSAKSRWVEEEIRSFIGLGRGERIFLIIIAGEPHSPDPGQECFPAPLREEGAVEPLAVDLRPGRDSKHVARLRLLAGMLGVPFDELRQREQARRQRRLAIAASVLAVAFLTMTGLAAWALISRNEAVRQRDLAEQRTLTAQRTVSFVKDLFRVADPSEARGRSIPVSEVLQRGLEQIRTGLGNEPSVRADLGVTLAEVYTALGEIEEADRLIRWTFSIRHGEREVRVRQLAAFADVRLRMGDVERATAAASRAVALGRTIDALDPALLPRALVTLGESQIENGDFGAARSALAEAYRLNAAAAGPISSDAAMILEDLGQIELLEGNLPGARQRISRALAIRRRLEGDMSPSVSDNMIALARIAIGEGDSALAERLVRARLPIDERVLGRDNPGIAEMLNDLGRALLEQRKYAEARTHLERATGIMERAGRDRLAQLAFIQFNLGIVYKALGQAGPAREALGRADRITASLEDPVNLVTRVELGDLMCQSGDAAGGQAMVRAAQAGIAEAYAGQPWRGAWTEIVLGSCLLRTGNRAAAAQLIARNMEPIRERWRPGSHFRAEAERRLAAANRAG